MSVEGHTREQSGATGTGEPAGDGGVQRRWAVDEQDPEIAVPMSGYGDNIPQGRRETYSPHGFRSNPAYYGSDETTEPMRRRKLVSGREVLPEKFAGKIPWMDYKKHFEVCMRINCWSDVEAGQFLASRLQGPALKVLNNIPLGREITYTELTFHLDRRFGPGEQAENFLYELRMRRRQPKESLQELGQSIRDLTCLAYPELGADVRERLARGHFSDAIDDPEIRAGIFRSQTVTLDDAIRAGLMTESFIKTERARERARPAARHVRSIDDKVEPKPVPMDERTKKEIDEIKSNLSQLMNMMKHLNMRENRGNSDLVCYRCKQAGHIAKYCPNPALGNERRPTQWAGGRSNQRGPQV